MISLQTLANQNEIETTGAKPKLPIKIEGVTSKTLDVYRIPLQYLYYNNENGRIASAMASHQDDIVPGPDVDGTEYNNLVAELIENSNPKALKKTQKSIAEAGQQEYGWVLDDGRVVDGNRRLTALRKLQQSTGKTYYFEAVLLPFSYSNKAERAKIKQLELAIQMGIEDRESYDSVDLAVDIYQTTGGDNPIMTIADYATTARMKKSEVQAFYDGADYINQFLAFIGAPKTSYDIIKDNKAWAMFYTMGKTLRSEFGDSIEEQVAKRETIESYFGLALHEMHVGVEGTSARTHFRDYGKKIVKTADNKDFNEDVQDIVEDLADAIQTAEVKDARDLSHVLVQEDKLISEFGDTYNGYIQSAKDSESVEKLIKRVRENVKSYQTMRDNNGLLGSLNYNQVTKDQLIELQGYMRDLYVVGKELFEIYGDEIN